MKDDVIEKEYFKSKGHKSNNQMRETRNSLFQSERSNFAIGSTSYEFQGGRLGIF